MNKRTFIPSSKYCGSSSVIHFVEKWVWTKGHGLKVLWKDGTWSKSDYKSLKELFAGEKIYEIN